MSHPELPEPGSIAKGELIGIGLTGIVELSDGYAVKTPWPGKDGLQSQDDIFYRRVVQPKERSI
jgi:hypothetical protein